MKNGGRVIRIGNAQGFWGDNPDAPANLLRQQPNLDYLTLDYLAELSMSILAVQREKDSAAGFPRDFLQVIRSLVPFWKSGHPARLVTNAGGLNPRGCAEECRRILDEAGLSRMRIGVVSGDDVLERLRMGGGAEAETRNMETGEPLSVVADRLVTANAYLGGKGIAVALERGANLVITGRVADPSLVTGIAVHAFGWAWDDHARVAGATVGGHLIECGTQVTGGFSTHWLEVERNGEVGFPVIEISSDGNVVVTKPDGTGGEVSERTVKEQLLYEIGDPGKYLSPDATVSFLGLRVKDLGSNRVAVSGAAGAPPPGTLKVSASYRDGFTASGMLVVFGREAARKARRCGEVIFERLAQAGFVYARQRAEVLGTGAAMGGVVSGVDPDELMEVVLRVSVWDLRREMVERFTRELAPLVTAGPQGVTGYAGGRPRVHPVFGYWPCLMGALSVEPVVDMMGGN